MPLENEVYFFQRSEIEFFRLNLNRDHWSHFLNFMSKIQNFSSNTFWKKTIGPRHTPVQGCRLSPIAIGNIIWLHGLWVLFSELLRFFSRYITAAPILFFRVHNFQHNLIKNYAVNEWINNDKTLSLLFLQASIVPSKPSRNDLKVRITY